MYPDIGHQAGHFNPYTEYTIKSAMDPSMVLSVEQGGDSLILLPDKQHNHQKFTILENNGRFLIISVSGKVIEVPDGANKKGAKLGANYRTEYMNQIWEIKPAEKKNGFHIKSFCDMVMDAEAKKTKPRTPIIQYPSNGGMNQIWKIQPVPVKVKKDFKDKFIYEIVSALDKSMCLTLWRPDDANSPKRDKLIINERKNQKKNQKFKIIQYHDGSCDLMCGDLKMEVEESSPNNGAHPKFTRNELNKQRCWFEQAKEHPHGYYIKTFCGKYLDVEGSKVAARTHVLQWEKTGNANQVWFVEKFEAPEEEEESDEDKKLFDEDEVYEIVSGLDKTMSLAAWKPEDPNSPNRDKLIIVKKNKNAKNQKFRIVEHKGRAQLICGELSLSVPEKSHENGVQLRFVPHENNKQKCTIIPAKKQHNGYYIKTGTGKFLDVKEGKTDPRTPVIQWEKTKNQNQLWFITPAEKYQKQFDPEALYEIVTDLNKEMVLAAWKPDDPNSPNKDKMIIIKRNPNAKNQKFRIVEGNDGRCDLICGELSMAVPEGSHKNGINLHFIHHEKNKQKCWVMRDPEHPQAFYIKSFCGSFLEVQDSKTDPRTLVIQSQMTKKPNQLWHIHKL